MTTPAIKHDPHITQYCSNKYKQQHRTKYSKHVSLYFLSMLKIELLKRNHEIMNFIVQNTTWTSKLIHMEKGRACILMLTTGTVAFMCCSTWLYGLYLSSFVHYQLSHLLWHELPIFSDLLSTGVSKRWS